MSIITFWNESREQTGQTCTAIAFATKVSIERNSKVLLISTSFNDSTMRRCYWGEDASIGASLFNAKNSTVAVENGVEGLYKLIASKKLTPSIITDYTRVIFKGRLEVIPGFTSSKLKTEEENVDDYKKIADTYGELIKIASQYYDMVIVDLDKRLDKKVKDEILAMSTVNVNVLSQKMEAINLYYQLKLDDVSLIKNRCVPVIGKYFKEYKYNSKNIARFLQEKKEFDLVPFNLLFMEAAEEAKVVDLFLKLRNIKDKNDENYIFMQCILNLTNNILKKLQQMQMKMR